MGEKDNKGVEGTAPQSSLEPISKERFEQLKEATGLCKDVSFEELTPTLQYILEEAEVEFKQIKEASKKILIDELIAKGSEKVNLVSMRFEQGFEAFSFSKGLSMKPLTENCFAKDKIQDSDLKQFQNTGRVFLEIYPGMAQEEVRRAWQICGGLLRKYPTRQDFSDFWENFYGKILLIYKFRSNNPKDFEGFVKADSHYPEVEQEERRKRWEKRIKRLKKNGQKSFKMPIEGLVDIFRFLNQNGFSEDTIKMLMPVVKAWESVDEKVIELEKTNPGGLLLLSPEEFKIELARYKWLTSTTQGKKVTQQRKIDLKAIKDFITNKMDLLKI